MNRTGLVYDDKSEVHIGAGNLKSEIAPSDITAIPNSRLNAERRNILDNHHLSQAERKSQKSQKQYTQSMYQTEFTEQIEEGANDAIALESDKSVVNIEDDEVAQIEDVTAMDAVSALPESRLRILSNQSPIEVKFQASATTTPMGLQPTKQFSLLDESQAESIKENK